MLVDCGSGKGYLGFILYELAVGPAGKGTLLGIESRPELAQAAPERAARLGYDRMRFLAADVSGAPIPPRVNLVTALHACDTATDDAIVSPPATAPTTWRWSPAARPRWPGSSPTGAAPTRPSPSCTATPGTGASWARTSPT